jgi:hypothetical protein
VTRWLFSLHGERGAVTHLCVEASSWFLARAGAAVILGCEPGQLTWRIAEGG